MEYPFLMPLFLFVRKEKAAQKEKQRILKWEVHRSISHLYIYDLNPLFPGETHGLSGAAGGAGEVRDAHIRLLNQLPVPKGHAAGEVVGGEVEHLLSLPLLPRKLRPVRRAEPLPEARVGEQQDQLYIEVPLPFQQHQLPTQQVEALRAAAVKPACAVGEGAANGRLRVLDQLSVGSARAGRL